MHSLLHPAIYHFIQLRISTITQTQNAGENKLIESGLKVTIDL